MEKNMKKRILTSVKTIKQKIKAMKNNEDTINYNLDKVFKPLIDPLNKIADCKEIKSPISDKSTLYTDVAKNSSMLSNDSSDISEDNFNDDASSYKSVNTNLSYDGNKREYLTPVKDEKIVTMLNTPLMSMLNKDNLLEENNSLNVPFGIRSENNKLWMGSVPISFKLIGTHSSGMQISLISIGDKSYEITNGIKELLFKKKPDLNLVSEQDRITYKDILENTHAHKRDFKSTSQIKGDKGMKYNQIIKPLFYEYDQLLENKVIKRGGSLPCLKKSYKKNTDFIYWDDPNELIERLKLLVASSDAGNTNHDNEIISLIEELKEAGIIKE